MYVLDTNIYVDAAERLSFAERAATFIEQSDQRFAVSSVVVAELLLGLADEDERESMLAKVYGGVQPTILLTPIHQDWEQAADALRHLGGRAVTPRRSFWNDLLLASTCARTGSTLITSNVDDFRRIARQIPVLYVAPWPSR